jgi:hypothetical protein
MAWFRRVPETEWERGARLNREDVKAARELAETFAERREVQPWGLEARIPGGWTCREGATESPTHCRSDRWSVTWDVKEGADNTPGKVLADWAEQAHVRALQSNRDSPGAPGFVAREALADFDGYLTVEQTTRRPFLAYTFHGWRKDGRGGQRKLLVRAETSAQEVISSLGDRPAEGLAVVLSTAKAGGREQR